MTIFDNQKKPDFKCYCNSIGELFDPDCLVPVGTALIAMNLPSLVHLPYHLQGLYERYWRDGRGALNYIAELDGRPGLLIITELGIDEDDKEVFTSVMATLMEETVIPAADRIEKSLRAICPQANVYVGDCSGFNECHELCVFIPADAGHKAICHALYVLHLYGEDGSALPTSTAEIVECSQFDAFMSQNYNFSAATGLASCNQGCASHLVEFRESGCGNTGAVMTARVVSQLPLDEIKEVLRENIALIKAKAAACGETVDPDDLIARALNADFAGAWVWTTVPSLSIQF